MKRRIFFIACVGILSAIAFTIPYNTGVFDANADIGNPKMKGSAAYHSINKEYDLKGGGYNIWFERDELHYLYKEMSGDFVATGEFELVGKGVEAHRKTGWMVRESMDDNAAHLSAVLHGDGLTVMQWRVAKGEKMRDPEDELFTEEKNVQVIQLERKGNEYTMRVGVKNGKLQTVGSHTMANMQGKVMLGLFVCSHNPDVLEEAKVRNVTIVQKK